MDLQLDQPVDPRYRIGIGGGPARLGDSGLGCREQAEPPILSSFVPICRLVLRDSPPSVLTRILDFPPLCTTVGNGLRPSEGTA